MSGKLLKRVRLDADRHITKGGFEETISLTTPDGVSQVLTKGFATKHWISFDQDGNSISSKNAHISISESKLVSLDYPVRDTNGEVRLYGHKVSVSDSSGVTKDYVINDVYPDETIGLIICILGDYIN